MTYWNYACLDYALKMPESCLLECQKVAKKLAKIQKVAN